MPGTRSRFNRTITLAAAAFISIVFLYAAVDKAFHYYGFVNAIDNYQLIPAGTGDYLALPLILVELWIGVCLLIPRFRAAAAVSGAGLLLAFTLLLGIDRLLGGEASCGCWFTITLAESTGAHIGQNLLLALLALTVWWNRQLQLKGSQTSPQPA